MQAYSLFAYRGATNLFRPPVYWPDFLVQSDIIGVRFGLHCAALRLLHRRRAGPAVRCHIVSFGATAVTGRFVSLTMIRELGPVLTGIMVSGRNASSMASELGSMVVTEQIDAMRALGVDPMRKLVTPRIFACITMLFFLTIVANFFGILGGAAVTVFMNHQNGTQYFSMAYEYLRYRRHHAGPHQAALLRIHHCHHRLLLWHRTTGGTEGVGRSTIKAVVVSSVLIIFVDFLVTQVMLTIFG